MDPIEKAMKLTAPSMPIKYGSAQIKSKSVIQLCSEYSLSQLIEYELTSTLSLLVSPHASF